MRNELHIEQFCSAKLPYYFWNDTKKCIRYIYSIYKNSVRLIEKWVKTFGCMGHDNISYVYTYYFKIFTKPNKQTTIILQIVKDLQASNLKYTGKYLCDNANMIFDTTNRQPMSTFNIFNMIFIYSMP